MQEMAAFGPPFLFLGPARWHRVRFCAMIAA
jgi:hypothetical protein